MKRRSLGRAPDYTAAALVSGGVNLFCLLVAIRAAAGFPQALIFSAILFLSLHWVQRRATGG